MKKVLITGENSYIGTNFEKWLGKDKEKYAIDTIDVRDVSWKEKSFSGYDTVFHVAGIAHVSKKEKMKELYYRVNRDLTIEIAKKAKNDYVKQFIFMSSIIVYGNGNSIINGEIRPKPENFYGMSKLQAEEHLIKMETSEFKIVILRPPMVYGKHSKGNYPRLAKISSITPIFPDIDNKRSMIHIDNLCEFVKLMIDNSEAGIFFPQNKEYVRTSDVVKLISGIKRKKVVLIKFLNPVIRIMIGKSDLFTKLFGDLVYEKELSFYKESYWVRGFKESIEATEL